MKTILINAPTKFSEVEFEQTDVKIFRACFGDYDGYGSTRKDAFADLVSNFPNGEEIEGIKFPNSFDNWHETHYFISVHVDQTEEIEGTLAYRRRQQQGTGGLWELAEDLTDEFEKLHVGRKWDGEWMDELEQWLAEKDKQDSDVNDKQKPSWKHTN